MKTVYVVTQGRDGRAGAIRVYDSLERAIGACLGKHWTRTIRATYPGWPSLERVKYWDSTINDEAWDCFCEITPMEVGDEGPIRCVDEIVVRTLNKQDGWDYLPISAEQADILLGTAKPDDRANA